MANVQKENGFTPTANALVEAICNLEVGGASHRVLRFIERKTYGYQKKEDAISLTQFERGTGLHRITIIRSLETLESMRVISVNRRGSINVYKINKDYDTWGSSQNDTRGSSQNVQTSSQNDTKTSSQNVTYKRNKENTKEISKTKVSQSMSIKGYNENQHFDDLPAIGDDGEVEKPKEKTKRHYKEVYEVFYRILNIQPLTRADWAMNTTEQKSADNLYTMKGLEQVERALILFRDNKDVQYCPKIHSPNSLVRKWKQLYEFKEENGL